MGGEGFIFVTTRGVECVTGICRGLTLSSWGGWFNDNQTVYGRRSRHRSCSPAQGTYLVTAFRLLTCHLNQARSSELLLPQMMTITYGPTVSKLGHPMHLCALYLTSPILQIPPFGHGDMYHGWPCGQAMTKKKLVPRSTRTRRQK